MNALRLALASDAMSAWVRDARCAGAPREIFFPERGESTRAALALCRECPVRKECLEYALAAPERFGIWGGVSERERRRIARRRRLDGAAA